MKRRKSVQELFLKSSGQVIYKWHHYLPIYESLFQPYIGSKVKVLEIGVLRGGSLKLWREYFGKDSQIYGIDIDPSAKQFEEKGIRIFIGDQSDKNFLAELINETGGFDIVIDDGAHTNFMILSSLETLYPATSKLYIVEDTHALYWWHGFYSLIRDIQCALYGKQNILEVLKHLARLIRRLLSGNLSFMKFVYRRLNALTTEWHGYKPHTNTDGKSLKEIKNKSSISNFTLNTNGIRVYDSLVVFEKGAQDSRIVEFR